MSLQDETGTGPLEFQKLTPEMHVQQLMIDLRDANEENKRLREDLAREIEKSKRSRYDCGVIALLAIVITYAVCMAFSVATK